MSVEIQQKGKVRNVFILSMPRSGSTWLGKIFDSHPNVRYHHEPDTDMRPPQSLQQFFVGEPSLEDIQISMEYATKLLAFRSERASMSLPQFGKRYRSTSSDYLYRLAIILAKGLNRFGASLSPPPEMLKTASDAPVEVVKSVSLVSRAPYVRMAFPEADVIHLLRHPCGYVSSRLRGEKLGFSTDSFVDTMVKSPYCLKKNITAEYMKGLRIEEQMALGWLASNQFAMDSLNGDPRYLPFSYDELCQQPSLSVANLMAWNGLGFYPEIQRFVEQSTSPVRSSSRYFSVQRDPKVACAAWKSELDASQIARITRIVEESQVGQFVLEKS